MHQIFVSGKATNVNSFNAVVNSQNRADAYYKDIFDSCLSAVTAEFNLLQNTDAYLSCQLQKMEALYECYKRA